MFSRSVHWDASQCKECSQDETRLSRVLLASSGLLEPRCVSGANGVRANEIDRSLEKCTWRLVTTAVG